MPITKRISNARYRIQQRIAAMRSPRSRDQIHNYWRAPTHAGNKPDAYVTGKRSEFVVALLDEYGLGPDASVLEIGTNVGRNLNALWEAGYRRLAGVEISPPAVEAMARTFPDMHAAADIRIGAAEELLPGFEDGAVDAVYSMAVLHHIHPDSQQLVFENIARICRHVIVTIEGENHVSSRHFPRKYREVFEALGFRQVHETDCAHVGDGITELTARVFHR